jgi:DNA helicase-2/ATP-dependent DNA helicase PcrA
LVRIGVGTARPSGKIAAGGVAEAQRADSGRLKTGTRVRHAKFGKGVVMYTTGSGAKQKVTIRFATGVSKQFMASVAPLEILEGK